MLYLLQALTPELDADAGSTVAVVLPRSGADFGRLGTDSGGAHPWRGGLAGMLKTASRESPAARFRAAVDFDDLPEPASR